MSYFGIGMFGSSHGYAGTHAGDGKATSNEGVTMIKMSDEPTVPHGKGLGAHRGRTGGAESKQSREERNPRYA